MRQNQIHHLNATASYVWSEYDGRKSFSEVAAALASHFSVDFETAKADVERLVSELKGLNLFVETDAPTEQTP
jgi:hypothetical protein